ncbi:MAG: universal stress protein [Gammaproteobacteria bacterium]|nr:universal stress protein [Gammaproteobacteria bacterium]
MPKSILVISYVNETDNCSLKKAHHIANPLGAEIDVVRFIKPSGSGQPDEASVANQTAILSNAIAEVFADYEHQDAIKSQVAVADNIVSWVIDYCKGNKFDLIVKAGNRTESLFHTPCDWELIRNLEVPVLIACQQCWRSKPAVLAALDASVSTGPRRKLNNEVLKWAKKWATAFDCEIHLVYSFPVSNILKELDIVDVKNYARQHRAEGEATLAELIDGHDLPNVKMHITAGVPEKAIPQCANEVKAEVVIMGSMGHKGLKGMLTGNIAEKVMHNLRTDSLTIQVKD